MSSPRNLGYLIVRDSASGSPRNLYRFKCATCAKSLDLVPGDQTPEAIAERARRHGWIASHRDVDAWQLRGSAMMSLTRASDICDKIPPVGQVGHIRAGLRYYRHTRAHV